MILNQYGTKLTGKEITLTAPVKEFPQRKHLYIQCLLKVNDLYLTSRVKTNSYFLDDIQDFFSKNEIYCFPNFQLIGKSGFSHNYDFAIQKQNIEKKSDEMYEKCYKDWLQEGEIPVKK